MAFNSKLLSGNTNPYASEAVVVDTEPIVQYEMQRRAKKAASDAATDKYLQDLQKVDDKGLRAVDYAGLSEQTKASRDLYNANREAIKRPELDGGAALNKFMASIEGQKQYVAKSLQAKELEKNLGDYITKRKDAGDPLTPEELVVIDNVRNNSITKDDFYKDKNLKTWRGVQDLEDFNKYKQEDFLKDVEGLNKRNEGIRVPNQKLVPDPQTGKVSVRFADSYDDATYAKILDNASNLVNQIPKYKKFFENKIDGGTFMRLDDEFKKKFGRGISAATMKEDLAKAIVLTNIPQHIYKDKEETDEQRKRRLDNADYYAHLNAKEKAIAKRISSKGMADDKDANDLLTEMKRKSKMIGLGNNPLVAKDPSWWKVGMRISDILTPIANQMQFDSEDGQETFTPSQIAISEDGKTFYPVRKVKYAAGTLLNGTKIDKDEFLLQKGAAYTDKEMAAVIKKAYSKGREGVALNEEDDETITPQASIIKTPSGGVKKSSSKSVPTFLQRNK